MSASNNFITKPVLSTVCSLLIVIVGLIAIPILLIGTARLTAAVVPEGSTRAIKKATPMGGFCMSDVMVRGQVITVG